MLEKLTIAEFEGRVGDTFNASAADGRTLTLTLTSADELQGRPDADRAPFSLTFRDAAQDHVPQQTVAIDHPQMGSFDLFIVPVGPAPEGMQYEAIFT
jgi:hypothetical protein